MVISLANWLKLDKILLRSRIVETIITINLKFV